VASLPIRMIIMDRSWAVISTDSADSSRGATVLTSTGTVTALCALFESVWESAEAGAD